MHQFGAPYTPRMCYTEIISKTEQSGEIGNYNNLDTYVLLEAR